MKQQSYYNEIKWQIKLPFCTTDKNSQPVAVNKSNIKYGAQIRER